MKKNSLIIFTLLLISLQAFAEEKSTNQKTENVLNTKDAIKAKDNNIKDKLAQIKPKTIKVYDFNPVKNKNGIITIVEFNDLSCNECLKKANDVYKNIAPKNQEYIKYVYKHQYQNKTNLINQITLYGLIANNFDKFWDLKDILTQKNLKDNDQIINALKNLGIKEKDLYNSLLLNSKDLYNKIDTDNNYAKTLKISNTPTFFIDGYQIDADLDAKDVNNYINLKVDEFIVNKNNEDNKYKMGKF
jgi:protein-disulfide isomerase